VNERPISVNRFMGSNMRRREFIAGLGGVAAWPIAARAQQPQRMRRIGVLMSGDENEPWEKTRLSAFIQALADLGWSDGRNARIDLRWAGDDINRMRALAKELVDLRPAVIVGGVSATARAVQRETQTIPIVFLLASDPVRYGFVASLARPGGNMTGFVNYEVSLAGKWLELLTEVAPSVKRVAMLFNPDLAPSGGSNFLPSFEAAALSLKLELLPAPVRSDAEIESVMTSLGHEPRVGLVIPPEIFVIAHRATIIPAAARNNLPAVYSESEFVRDGGLLSYRVDGVDISRRAASYVDRILRGEKPGDLPVQLPTKFEMAVNLKTAKALGLTVPQSILLRADEVIE
jgi:putative ABC transport system substrate-binding protein